MPVRILGITGPIGCGKSTVASLAGDFGALDVIDADRIVHDLMDAGTGLARNVAASFGPNVVADDGSVDRPALARLVFGDPEALSRLEQLVHPAVRERIGQLIDAHRVAGHDGVVAIEAIRLLDSPIRAWCDAVWLIMCSSSEQRDRLLKARAYSDEELKQRLGSTPDFKTDLTVTTIHNNGSLDELKAAVSSSWVATFGV